MFNEGVDGGGLEAVVVDGGGIGATDPLCDAIEDEGVLAGEGFFGRGIGPCGGDEEEDVPRGAPFKELSMWFEIG